MVEGIIRKVYTIGVRSIYTKERNESMLAVISKWGNSQGIRLNRTILEAANLHVNDQVEIEIVEDEIIIKKSKKITMKSLFESYHEDDYVTEEMDWGEDRGREQW